MADPSDELLVLRGLAAGYGGRPVVSGVDFALHGGEILGLLGANGSGKSTLIKAITGQLPLLTGSITIGGNDLSRHPERAKAALGLAIDAPDLPTALSGRQYLELVASLRGCAPDDWPRGDVVDRLGLTPWLDVPAFKYSFGTRMKVSIAAALLGGPPLLVFDESLNGLDPVSAWEAKRIFKALAATGRHAIIVSTQIVEAVPDLCTRAIFLADGQVARSWDQEALADARRRSGGFEASLMAVYAARWSDGPHTPITKN